MSQNEQTNPPSRALATQSQGHYRNLSLHEAGQIANQMAKADMFPDIKTAQMAFVKIIAGQEMGISPFQAMSGIHIIKGKATIGANLMASKVKESGKYDYEVPTLSDKEAVIDFYRLEDGKRIKIGTSTFNEAKAKAAGLYSNPTWRAYPENMMFARAMSNGVRFYCPDVFAGAPVYTAEEMGESNVDEDGGRLVVEHTVKDDPTPPEEPQDAPEEPDAPIDPPSPEEPSRDIHEGEVVEPEPKATTPQLKMIFAVMNEKGLTDKDDQKKVFQNITGLESRTQLTKSSAKEFIEWLQEHDLPTLQRAAGHEEAPDIDPDDLETEVNIDDIPI